MTALPGCRARARAHDGEMTDPADIPATALAPAYAKGALSPVEVIEAVLVRVAAWETYLCATYALDPEGALHAARVAAAAGRPWVARAEPGPGG